ncbi:MAG: metal dependent phosphohydrolase [Candidatus Bathyarchaeota archaeon B63]|nr:MAG: metal dependent phosphohydrolase [Candidatus Bathyarchaeota archaeon B63]
MGCEDAYVDSGSVIDAGRFPRLARLLELAEPYLEKNDLGAAHTERVLKAAQRYFRIPAGMEKLVLATIILHDVGGSSIRDQYERGPEIAAGLLKALGYEDQFIREVCDMIGTHHDRLEDPPEPFRILYDSDQLAKFSEEEFDYYNSRRGFDWDNVIRNLYYEHSRRLAAQMRKRRAAGKGKVKP